MYALGHRRPNMTPSDDEYQFDEESGEWMPASELAAKRAAEGAVEVRDAVGNVLADGDQVTLIKDLEVKGAGRTLKQGTLIKSIRLTGDAHEIDCKFEENPVQPQCRIVPLVRRAKQALLSDEISITPVKAAGG